MQLQSAELIENIGYLLESLNYAGGIRGCVDTNMVKLVERYPNGFDPQRSMFRGASDDN